MNIFANRPGISLTLLLMLLPASSHGIDFGDDADIIWQAGANVYVSYAERRAKGSNDHPVNLPAAQVEAVLSALEIESTDSDKPTEPLFTAEQTTLLGRYLAQGLKEATPDQDIVFAMEKRASRPFRMQPVRYFVAGRAFHEQGRLNVIIGEHDRRENDAFESVYDPTNVGIVRYDFDHGRRARESKRFNKRVVAIDGVENRQLNGTRRDDWLVIDIGATQASLDRESDMRQRTETQRKRAELKELLNDQGDPARTPGATPAAIDRPRAAGITWSDLEEGLLTLSRLREKGLITEQEYELKKRQMLDALGPW